MSSSSQQHPVVITVDAAGFAALIPAQLTEGTTVNNTTTNETFMAQATGPGGSIVLVLKASGGGGAEPVEEQVAPASFALNPSVTTVVTGTGLATANLPLLASTPSGTPFTVKNTNPGDIEVDVTPFGADPIDGVNAPFVVMTSQTFVAGSALGTPTWIRLA